ncbi:AAA family ATPase [Paraburkholderia largidicola]|uniref:AAA+ ATPase domain-containing protein n=1 Tax=Paraburkholderia largidicola TaxID=3014751 RepID=A0A7I8BEV4_9BURK|nr:AAA family ATPase [Paraburkholderia sp. PGU16]BCF87065.1 hypothetical protein PPGU16_01320 [Paraburkholderia sp. PGU16]
MFHTRRDPSEAADINIISTTQVVAQNTEWLLPGFLPKKKLSLLAGMPGAGKTSIALYFAAVISSGGIWPDGSRAESGRVLIYAPEDGVADTIKPRLAAMGADLRNVEVIGDTAEFSGRSRRFDCQRDLGLLQQKLIGKGGYALVVIDPVTSIVSGNSNNNKAVRDALESLVRFADAVCAVLCLTHVSKGSSRRSPLERVMGDLAYGAVPRMVLMASRVRGSADADQCGVLVRAKTNIAPTDGGFEYQIEPVEVPVDGKRIQTSRLVWSPGMLSGSADEILKLAAGASAEMPGGALGRAAEFLQNALANGPMLCSELESHAVAAGISSRTLTRARKHLSVLSSKQSGAGPHSPNVLYLSNVPERAGGVGNAVGGLSFEPLGMPTDRWSPGYPMGYPAYCSAVNGAPPPFMNGVPSGTPPMMTPDGVPYGGVHTQYPPHLETRVTGFGMAPRASQVSGEAHAQVGTVGTVGTVERSRLPQPGDRPEWVSESNWDWLLQEYAREYDQTKRFDTESELEFQDRVARRFLDASCSDWERLDELGRVLVDAFNRLPYLGSLGNHF